MHRVLGISVLLALACAGPLASSRSSPLVGQRVEVSALDLYDRPVTLTTGEGRVRIVDFWATWCEPCKEQLPFLERLAREYEDQGLDVAAVSFDEDRASLAEFLKETPVSFTVLWDKGGGRLAEKLEVTRLPTTLLIGRDGKVREVHLGFDRNEAVKLEESVRKILAR